jgi:16S rRNA (uracil1498-N3)-methyltransferase
MPGVVIESSFDRFASIVLPSWSTECVRILAHPEGTHSMSRAIQPGRRVTIAIGPEGGWSRRENEVFSAHDFITVSLGRRTLRTDTALIALLALAYDGLAELPPHE